MEAEHPAEHFSHEHFSHEQVEQIHVIVKAGIREFWDQKISRLIKLIGWGGLVGFVILIGWGYTITTLVNENTEFRRAGDRFTQTDGQVLQAQINSLNERNDGIERWLVRIEAKLDASLSSR